jgi:hypothetical protein
VVRSAGRFIIPVLCPVAQLLAGCASDSTFTIAGRAPNPTAFEEDASACRHSVGPSVARFFGGTLLGAANGAYVGAASGGSSGDAALLGAAAGAVIGVLAGAVSGAVDSVSGDNYDLCMVRKGYQPVDPQSAHAEPSPTVERQSGPMLIRSPNDPAR